ncbi:MAG TPA: chemotaxis protein MotB [Rhodospirillaceae bacterium]|nr:chemotaxis protein MotB [Rhodospirillaceae bacterium]
MAFDDLEEGPEIFVKRIKIHEEGHHGGAWKVAYADFVTAMMAFFLLLWLLNATTEDQKQGISNYFEPIGAVKGSTGSGGLFGGISATDPGPIPEPGQTTSTTVDRDSSDRSKKEAETKKGDPDEQTKSKTEVPGVDPAHEERQLEAAKAAVQQAMAQIEELQELAPSVMIDIVPQGLRIQLMDNDKNPLFAPGSEYLNVNGRKLVAMVSEVVTRLPNQLSITGHTDTAEYQKGPSGRSNWELSIRRANSARRALKANGIPDQRVKTVDGRAATQLLDVDTPTSPRNRRIAVLVLRKAKKRTQKELAPTRIFKAPTQ